jgi:hypothetical protein
MKATLQNIFQTSFSRYAAKHRLPLKHHQAAQAIMSCRTPSLGGHEQHCPDGHESHIQYHSCRHRNCPKCNAMPKEQWVQKQFQKLLATDHYHVIFTLPHELLPLWRYNQRWFANTLFHVVNETMTTLAKDPKHLGALPGMIQSLHTWGRNLSLHPHIHCLMTGGGLTSEGEWKGVKHNYLFPVHVVRALYQGKMLSALRQGLRDGELKLPDSLSHAEQSHCFKELAKKKWNVRIQPPYKHGRGVMKYLANYVKGGPISNHRILEADASTVEFGYRDHRDGIHKAQRLATGHFIDRILDHVAEPRQHVIRHYGLYGHQSQAKRNLCRKHLGQALEQEYQAITWTDFVTQRSQDNAGCCSQCGKQLVRGVTLVKNSINRVPWSGHVQQAVRVDVETWSLERTVPPKRGRRFFLAESTPLN